MTQLEQVLSDTADFLQARLKADQAACEDARRLVATGRAPRCIRPLDAEVPGGAALIAVEKCAE
jgi:hypothetical protein